MRVVEILGFSLAVVLVVAMTILPSSMSFGQGTSPKIPDLIGRYDIDARIFKAIQVSYNEDFRNVLERRKKEQHGTNQPSISEVTDYQIMVEVDEKNFYIHYIPIPEMFGGGVHYTVSRKLFKLVDTKYSK